MRKYQFLARELREVERVAASDVRLRRMLKATPLVLTVALLSAHPLDSRKCAPPL